MPDFWDDLGFTIDAAQQIAHNITSNLPGMKLIDAIVKSKLPGGDATQAPRMFAASMAQPVANMYIQPRSNLQTLVSGQKPTSSDIAKVNTASAKNPANANKTYLSKPGPSSFDADWTDALPGGKPYLPAAVEAIPAMVGNVANAISDVSGYEYTGPGGGYLRRAAERGNLANEASNEFFGTRNPENGGEFAYTMAGSLAIPGPKFANAKGILGKGINAAYELFTPLRNNNEAAAVVGGVGTALGAGMSALAGTEQKPDANTPLQYDPTHVAEYREGSPAEKKLAAVDTELDRLNAEAFGYNEADKQAHDLTLEAFGWDEGKREPSIPKDPVRLAESPPAPDDDLSIAEWAGIVGAGAAGLFLGSKAPGALKRVFESKLKLPEGGLTGTINVPQRTPLTANLSAALTDSTASIRSTLNRIQSPRAANFGHEMDRVTQNSIVDMSKLAATTGEMPNSKVNIGNLSAGLNAMAQDAGDEGMQLIARAHLAQQALDQSKKATAIAQAKSSTPVGVIQPMFSKTDIGKLQSYVDVVKNDPKLSKYYQIGPATTRKLADYMLDRGAIDAKTHAEWTTNPEFMFTRKSDSAIGDTSFLGTTSGRPIKDNTGNAFDPRSLIDGEGIQTGNAANPLTDLPLFVKYVIDRTETDQVRGDILDELKNKKSSGVRAAPGNKPGDNTISAWRNGTEKHYVVEDNSLRHALEFNPTIATNALAQTFRTTNQLARLGTTGQWMQPIFTLKTALMNNMATMLTRQPGQKMGLIGQYLDGAGAKFGILDPTTLATNVPLGFARYIRDSAYQEIARNLTEHLISGHDYKGFWKMIVPDAQAQATLAARFTKLFDESDKAAGMRQGIYGGRLIQDDFEHMPMAGLEESAPAFARMASKQAYLEAKAAAGKATGANQAAKQFFEADAYMKSLGTDFNADKWARLYNTIHNGLRESVVHQTFSANRKTTDPIKAASEAKRAGGDMGVRGGNETLNTVNDLFLWVNAALQPTAETLKLGLNKGGAGKLALLTNFGTLFGTMVGTYMMAAKDPRVAEELRKNTDAQNGAVLIMPGGLKIPVDQGQRMWWGPTVALLNNISGIKDGEQHPEFYEAAKAWLTGKDQLDEDERYGIGQALQAGAQSMNPYSPANSTLLNTAGLGMGFDFGMSRFSGEPQTIANGNSVQFGSPLQERAGATQASRIMESVGGAIGNTLVNAATGLYFNLKEKEDFKKAAKVALSEFSDSGAKSNDPVSSMLYKGYEKVESFNDSPTQMYYDKKQGIAQYNMALIKEIQNRDLAAADPRVARYTPTQRVLPKYYNTQLGVIAAEVTKLNDTLERTNTTAELTALKNEAAAMDDLRQNSNLTAQQRNEQKNKLVATRKAYADRANFFIEQTEQIIRDRIGDQSFSFRGSNPKIYAEKPYDPMADKLYQQPLDQYSPEQMEFMLNPNQPAS